MGRLLNLLTHLVRPDRTVSEHASTPDLVSPPRRFEEQCQGRQVTLALPGDQWNARWLTFTICPACSMPRKLAMLQADAYR